ncbi:MAG: ScpA family protein [Pseudomonadota bacterium]
MDDGHNDPAEADIPAGDEHQPWPDDAVASDGVQTAETDAAVDALIVNLDGYEGPLDVLLDLARTQKVDLKSISVLALVEQYLAFVEEAKARNLELAADYLVMAAWLTFLKSRLLLPEPEVEDDGPTGEEMAARLAFQLQRLEAMRKAGARILNLPQLGREQFARGAPEGVRIVRKTEWSANVYDLLSAYSEGRIRGVDATIHIEPQKVLTIEEARRRIELLLGEIPDWSPLWSLTPAPQDDTPPASVVASSLNAVLELAKEGRLLIRQTDAFGAVHVRQKEDPPTLAVASHGPGAATQH